MLQNLNPGRSPWLRKGIGDDAAVIRPSGANESWLVTTDMLLESVDFRREWTSPRLLGAKSIEVNLSDLAAMGARPRFFTVSLGTTVDVSQKWILDFHKGLTESGRRRNAELIGGDLSSSRSDIVISIAALGESLNQRVLYRSGGRPGDLLYVTGRLGRSAAGLHLLQKGRLRPRAFVQREAVRAHLSPEARSEAGLWLAQSGMVHCMMDLSDGLSMDLPRLCAASGVGAEVRADDLPLFRESVAWGCDPMTLGLDGGEDYELLFSVARSRRNRLEQSYPKDFPPITCIGEMTGAPGQIWISGAGERRRRLQSRGFDHFRKGS